VVTTLPDFLAARLQEDEDTARAALDLMDEPWNAIPEGPEEENYSDEFRVSSGVIIAGRVEESKALHIALHDPARVLREVEAKRAILKRHHPSDEYESQLCTACQWDADCDAPRHDLDDEDAPCPDLRHLAAVYSDHPDYDERWRP
jgi:hypothetical protein